MQSSETKFILQSWKRFFLILGLVLLVASFSLIIIYSFVIKPDRVFSESVSLMTTGDYVSPKFYAEKGDWIEFSLTASNSSILRLYGMELGEVFRVVNNDENSTLNGARYTEIVRINVTNDYQVELDNMAAHAVLIFNYWNTVYDNNTFRGTFYQMRMPIYYPHLLLSGEAFLAASCGFLLIPIVSYFRFKARRLGINA